MSLRSRWLVRPPSLGSNQADSLRSRTRSAIGFTTGRRVVGAGSMAGAGPFDTLRPRFRVDGVMFGNLPPLPSVNAEVLVSGRVGGATEADLVPRPRMRIERGAGVAHPQAPHPLRGQAVRHLGSPDRVQQVDLGGPR